jgi:kynureninase
MTFERSLTYAQGRDAADTLARFRQQFAHPVSAAGEPLVYLCGHSLGLQPLSARQRVNEELDDWAALGVRGHEVGRSAGVA